ncbi:MAG: histidinol dehydrogenase [Chloroflexota bacterium]
MSARFTIYDLDEARGTILRRRPFDEYTVSARAGERLEALFGEPVSPQEAVRRIVRDVRERGDAALLDWTERIDGVALESIAVPAEEIEAGYAATPLEVVEALKLARDRIEAFYRRQPLGGWLHAGSDGLLGQLVLPIDRVGVYVPGGSAPLPSSLLMSAVPAQVAGVREVAACTPPGAGGSLPPVVLAAATVAGVEMLYRLGGAQAIAALAFGSESVRRVDKIVGPGNLFVTLAKREVYGLVGIDGLLGPTETLVIADDSADPATVAADLLAQAEHDVLAQALLLTPSRTLAEAVAREVAAQAAALPRREIIEGAIQTGSGAVIVPDLDAALEVANAFAPEHLQLSVGEPTQWLGKIHHAGAVFLGEGSCEVFGDYVAGPSHSLPTGGTARFASGINLMDFVKLTSFTGLGAEAARRLSAPAATLARAEELDAHAAAAERRGA